MRLTSHGIQEIEKAFGIKNGAWTKEAVTYVGLSFPLTAGWKNRLLHEDLPDHAPIVKGISVIDHQWVIGLDIDRNEMFKEKDAHESARAKDEHMYVMSQLGALESIANDLRQQADDFRDQVRKLRKSISEDDF